MATVVQTDFAWPDVSIERAVIEGAGHSLVTGPSEPSPAAAEALVAAHDPAAILTCWAEVSAEAIRRPTALKVVQRLGVGRLDNIAVEAATARGAWVANVPDYCVEEVSDHAVAMAFAWFRGIVPFDRAVKEGRWEPAGARLRRGAVLTAGILGLGRATARKLAALGMTVLGHDIAAWPDSVPAQPVGLDALAAQSDLIVVHLPLTDDTHHLVDAAFLARVKPGAFLVNVSRGPVVKSDALIEALEAGRLAGAGLDVVEGRVELARRAGRPRGRDRDAARRLLLRRLARGAQAARRRGGGARARRRRTRAPVQPHRLTLRGRHR